MAIKTLAIGALAAILATGAAQAQQWNRFQAPGSPFTTYTGPNGWSGNTFQAPGSPFSNTTIQGPNGQQQHCSTFQAPGSPFASTTCN